MAVGALVGIVALSASGVPDGASAVIQGESGWIAFQSDRAGGDDVWVVDGDGAVVRRLGASSPTARDGRPSWASPAVLLVFGEQQPAEPGQTVTFSGCCFDDGAVTLRWPGVPGTFVPTDVSQTRMQAVVPPGVRSGAPCVNVAGTGAVPAWPGAAPAPRITVAGAPADPADDIACSQPLAFQSDRAGSWDIWLYDPPTGSLQNITAEAPASDETSPAWSSRTETTAEETSVRETPVLAFASDRTGADDLYLHDPNAPAGTPPLNLTNTPGAQETNPDWSPDGAWLTYERTDGTAREIWVVAIDPVTNAVGLPRKITSGLGGGAEPTWFRWRSDGTGEPGDVSADEVAFEGLAAGTRADLDLHHVEAPIADPPFGEPTEWTDISSTGDDRQPTWDPVGEALIYASDGFDGAADFDLRSLSRDGTVEQALTTGPGNDTHPSRQPLMLSASVRPRRPRGRATRRLAHTASVTATPTATATLQPTVSPTPSPTATPTPTPTATPTPPARRSRCTQVGTPRADILLRHPAPGRAVRCRRRRHARRRPGR